MSERKILVEVTEEEYELIKNGNFNNNSNKKIEMSNIELIEELKKRLDSVKKGTQYDQILIKEREVITGKLPIDYRIIDIAILY